MKQKKQETKEIRMLEIEEKLNRLIGEYSIDFFDGESHYKANACMFLYKRLKEEGMILSISEIEYFTRACLIPLDDIEKEVEKYDKNASKISESLFLSKLCERYNEGRTLVEKRVEDVRKIRQMRQKFDVMAVPRKEAYISTKESNANGEDIKFIEGMAETFKTNNLNNKGPVLRNIRK